MRYLVLTLERIRPPGPTIYAVQQLSIFLITYRTPKMRLTTPTSTARVGNVEIRGVQRVLELEALDTSYKVPHGHQQPLSHTVFPGSTQSVSPADLHAIQSRTAIVVPCKDEDLERIYSVWAAIPASSLLILVSASAPDAYALERNALADFCRFTGRSAMSIHQRDPKVAGALRAAGLPELLDEGGDDLVHRGKGEGMIIGIALAAIARGPPAAGVIHMADKQQQTDAVRGPGCGQDESRDRLPCDNGYPHDAGTGNMQHHSTRRKDRVGDGGETPPPAARPDITAHHDAGCVPGYYKYIGFIDADNFVPGSVQEYCRAFSAGLHLAQSEDAMVRISWASKPKVRDGKLEFRKSGRSSEIVNRWLNRLLEKMGADVDDVGGHHDDGRGAEEGAADLICTGNAGEHALTMSLALKLRLASGYAIEPFHFLDIFERFAGDEVTCAAGGGDDKTASLDGANTTVPAAIRQQLPASPYLSPLPSPAESPIECSPLLSASGESTSPTSPSVFSTGLGKVPAGQQLPPAIKCYNSTTTAAQARAFNDSMTPPISPISAAHHHPAKPPAVQILQIRTINPHFHESRGEAHITRMWKQGLSAIYHSAVVTDALAQYREDLRSAIFSGGGVNVSTPPVSNSVSVATTPSSDDEGGEANNKDAVAAAADWQPDKSRIYPPAGAADLRRLRCRLEGQEGGTFWCSGRAEVGGAGPSDDTGRGGLGFDPVDVLGLGPVDREKLPEGDVDLFLADASEGM